MCELRINFNFGSDNSYGSRHVKRSQKALIVVIPKEGWVRQAVLGLVLVSHQILENIICELEAESNSKKSILL